MWLFSVVYWQWANYKKNIIKWEMSEINFVHDFSDCNYITNHNKID